MINIKMIELIDEETFTIDYIKRLQVEVQKRIIVNGEKIIVRTKYVSSHI